MAIHFTESLLEENLKTHFGYNAFRPYQKEIIASILSGKDTIAILPTGAGKSLCYQLPALLVPGVTVVISPLISLMQDQVHSLAKNGIAAAFINSSLPYREMQSTLQTLHHFKLIYIAPERFTDTNFLQRLKEVSVSFIVVDEAHCISQWGHSFRPDYRQLCQLKKIFPQAPVMALTATATPDVEKDIAQQLSMTQPAIIKGSFDRPNLTIRIHQKIDPLRQIKEFIAKRPNESGIIYAATRKTVDSIYDLLKHQGHKIGKYHAGMSDKERMQAHHDFLHDKTTLMVATVAFGMGIHKPDIRWILHHDMPQTVEQYYQEMGRAGRDGLPAECLMLYNSQDTVLAQFFLESYEDLAVRKIMRDKMWQIYRLCSSSNCRRNELLRYFGETFPSHDCRGCDNCIDNVERIDGTVIAQKILSCVGRVRQSFGVKHVIEVLRGSRNQAILRNGHDTLSTHGLMKECSEMELRYYIDSLLQMGLLTKSEGEYPVLKWTEGVKDVLQGNKPVEFKKKIFKESKLETSLNELKYDAALFNRLRQLRLRCAEEESIPPYVVFSDRSLLEMAAYFPRNHDEFVQLNGVGPHKWGKYGFRFLNAISQYMQENNKEWPQPHVEDRGGKKEKKEKREKPEQPKRVTQTTSQTTLQYFNEGMTIDEIMQRRELSKGTIISHIVEGIEAGLSVDIDRLVSKEKQELIRKAIAEKGKEKLKPLKECLPEEITYDEIRVVCVSCVTA